jgi:hypothetical protein
MAFRVVSYCLPTFMFILCKIETQHELMMAISEREKCVQKKYGHGSHMHGR